jgi:hypothetical protein
MHSIVMLQPTVFKNELFHTVRYKQKTGRGFSGGIQALKRDLLGPFSAVICRYACVLIKTLSGALLRWTLPKHRIVPRHQ